jgi:hypothetical protein
MTISAQALALPLQTQLGEDAADTKLRSLKFKRWLRTDEVALYLGTTCDGVKNKVYRGQLIRHKYHGRNYYDREEIDRGIETSNNKKGRFQWR